jgi:NAD(P)-dependent dehydrogenase (short-subunit alcohol dehydrogenase family)
MPTSTPLRSATESSERVVLVSGASSGIGQACARRLAGHGFRVFGTSRRAGDASQSDDPVEMVGMDVDDDASVDAAVATVLERAGRIDAVVNNAGWALAGSVEDTTADEVRAQLQTNVVGLWRVCRAVLPAMRAAGSGRIVNVGSIAGGIGLPFQAAYSASKFAVAGFTEALSGEVRPFGLHAVLIEPGNHRTGLTAARRVAAGARGPSAYAARFAAALGVIERDENRGPPPEAVALLIHRVLDTSSPRLRYTVGPPVERMAGVVKALLPGRLFERLLMREYGIG